MKIKVDDYVRYFDSGYKKEMYGWVDSWNKDMSIVNVQCDDGWNGDRGISCRINEVKEILPPKERL